MENSIRGKEKKGRDLFHEGASRKETISFAFIWRHVITLSVRGWWSQQGFFTLSSVSTGYFLISHRMSKWIRSDCPITVIGEKRISDGQWRWEIQDPYKESASKSRNIANYIKIYDWQSRKNTIMQIFQINAAQTHL